MSDIRARAYARTHADGIDEIDGIGRDLRVLPGVVVTRLTGLVTRMVTRLSLPISPISSPRFSISSLNLVTQNSRSDPISPISSPLGVYRKGIQ